MDKYVLIKEPGFIKFMQEVNALSATHKMINSGTHQDMHGAQWWAIMELIGG